MGYKKLNVPQRKLAGEDQIDPDVMATLTPLNDRILVRRLEAGDRSAIIAAPQIGKLPAVKARIVALGPGTFDEDGDFIPMWPELVPGAVICFSGNIDKYDWHDVPKVGDYLTVRQNDILGLIAEEAEISPVDYEPNYDHEDEMIYVTEGICA